MTLDGYVELYIRIERDGVVDEATEFVLPDERFKIGKHPENNIQIPLGNACPQHGEIYRENDTLFYEDKSKHGTTHLRGNTRTQVTGERVTLQHSDCLDIADDDHNWARIKVKNIDFSG